jgi:hypothetical protein
MADKKVTAADVADLLAKGKIAEATAAAKELAAANPAVTAAADAPKEPPPPRPLNAILLDVVKSIHSLLGNSPALVPLVHELEENVSPPEKEAKPAQ